VKFRIRFSNQIVGLFVLGAFAAAITAIIALGMNQRWFEQTHQYYSEFSTARGLSPGLPISFRGFQIGQVRDVTLTEDNTVRVSLTVSDSHIDKLTEHSVLQLQSNPLGIGGGLVLHQGRIPTGPPDPESLIPSWNSARGIALRELELVEVVTEGDVIGELLDALPSLVATVNRTAASGDALLVELRESLSEGAEGPLPELLRSAELAGSELQGLLVTTEALVSNLRPLTEELEQPEGAIVRLVGPELDEALKQINRTLAHIEDFSGFVAGTSPEIRSLLYESREALETGHEVLHGLRNNPLLRGGIQPRPEPASSFESYRQEEF